MSDMEFCSSCGILLPIDVVGKSLKCRACTNDYPAATSNGVCCCEYCKSPIASRTDRKSESETKRIGHFNIHVEKSVGSKRSKSKKFRNDRESDPKFQHDTKPQPEVENYDTVMEDWGTNALDKKLERSWGSGDWDWGDPPQTNVNLDWGIQPSCSDWGEEIATGDWGEEIEIATADHANSSNGTGDWTLVKKKSSTNTMFGEHEFPPLQNDFTENDALQIVRQDWERQQEEYKKKLIMRDTSQIAKLVSGHRRKANKKRFYVGGVDISFIKDDPKNACACLSVVSLPDLELVYQAIEMVKLNQPYFPGFLAFREIPSLLILIEDLKRKYPQYIPDVIMADGNGILHPRGCGLASQLGVILDMPTMGVAKTLISAQGIVDDDAHKAKKHELSEAGECFDLVSHETGKVLGKCVRVHDNAPNPVYVSVGHKISLNSAVWLALECCKYRIPEPIRRADLDSREYISKGKTEPYVFVK